MACERAKLEEAKKSGTSVALVKPDCIHATSLPCQDATYLKHLSTLVDEYLADLHDSAIEL